jgi:hypothetical protein
VALLVAISASYAWQAGQHRQGWLAAIEAPEEHAGQELTLPLYKVGEAEPGRIFVTKLARNVPVVGPLAVAASGDTVSMRGTFHPGGCGEPGHPEVPHVVATELEVHHLRAAKRSLGLLTLFGLLFWLPRRFRRVAGPALAEADG